MWKSFWKKLSPHSASDNTHWRKSLNKCNECFCRLSHLIQHQRTHSGENPTSGGVGKASAGAHLAQHQRTHTGEKPYECNECAGEASVRDLISLNTHVSTRGRDPTSVMSGKNFSQNSDSVRHRRAHREKPYHCNECGENFSRISIWFSTREPTLGKSHMNVMPVGASAGALTSSHTRKFTLERSPTSAMSVGEAL